MISGSELIISFFAGFISSMIGSFAGGGSSLIMMPIIIWGLNAPYGSLLAINKMRGSSMTIASTYVHWTKNNINEKLFWVMIVAAMIGTAIGQLSIDFALENNLINPVIGICLIGTAAYLSIKGNIGTESGRRFAMSKRKYIVSFFAIAAINIINGLVGGTGIFMTVFFVVYLKMSFIRATAHTMLIYSFINSMHAIYLLFTESTSLYLIIAAIIGAWIGSTIGTKFQYLKGNKWVKTGTVSVMVVIAVQMLLN
jgi:uncharacterized membrane protein YfcA